MPAIATLNARINREVTDLRDWSQRMRATGAIENWWTTIEPLAVINPATLAGVIKPRVGVDDLRASAPVGFEDDGAYRPVRWSGQPAQGLYTGRLTRPENNILSIIIAARNLLDRTETFRIRGAANGTFLVNGHSSWNNNIPFFNGNTIYRRGSAAAVGARFLYAYTFDWNTGHAAIAGAGEATLTTIENSLPLPMPGSGGPLEVVLGGVSTRGTFANYELMTLPGVDLRANPTPWELASQYYNEIWSA